jgi:uncharacterized membrane protein
MFNTQSRWRSKAAWACVIALILFVLKNYGLLAPIGLTEDSFNELVTLVFSVLMAFGVFNNPEKKGQF